jgi:hypothetical protein
LVLSTVSSDASGAIFLHSYIESFSFLAGVPFILVAVLLGGIAGNTNKWLDFHGLELVASGFIVILRT